MNSQNNILENTLNRMPISFSSNEFTKMAKKSGISQREIDRGIIANYLKLNANRHEDSRRMYTKKQKAVDIFQEFHSQSTEIQRAIDLLKSKGYKIMKPVKEYVEV